MNDRASTLLSGRRERIERILNRELVPPQPGPSGPPSPDTRGYLREEAEDLYWNELEWENITDEEALEGGPLTELAFPGFLAFVRGLLLREAMPDSKAPASPHPQVVEDILDFLCGQVLELEDGLAINGADSDRLRTDVHMTSRLIDLVLYRFHDLGPEDVERVEAESRSSA